MIICGRGSNNQWACLHSYGCVVEEWRSFLAQGSAIYLDQADRTPVQVEIQWVRMSLGLQRCGWMTIKSWCIRYKQSVVGGA